MGQLAGCFSPNDHWCQVPSHVTWGKSEVAAFNSVMRDGGKLEDELQNTKKLTPFFFVFFKEHLNGNMNLVVGISVMTFEHIFIYLIL